MEIERDIVFPASPAEVWEALTEPERLEEWFASEVSLDARPGGEGVFRWGDGDERRAVVHGPREFSGDVSLLTEAEKAWLNAYHARVREVVAPQVDEATRAWLTEATRAI